MTQWALMEGTIWSTSFSISRMSTRTRRNHHSQMQTNGSWWLAPLIHLDREMVRHQHIEFVLPWHWVGLTVCVLQGLIVGSSRVALLISLPRTVLFCSIRSTSTSAESALLFPSCVARQLSRCSTPHFIVSPLGEAGRVWPAGLFWYGNVDN